MPKRSRSSRSGTQTLAKTSTVSLGGRRTYVTQFIEVVAVYALKNGLTEASVYFDVPTGTIQNWVKKLKELNDAEIKGILVKSHFNPYRETAYNIQRRIRLSDKLFGELELTVEAERMRNDGYIPAHVLSKLAQSFSTLVDKRRLEEGAHTALVQEAKEPEEIYAEGRNRILDFKKRFSLPEGNVVTGLPDGEGRTEGTGE